MDVNETLRRCREGAAEALAESGSKRDDLVDELAQAFDDLDNCLKREGFAPDSWPLRPRRDLLAMERRAFRLRNALLEAGVPENLVRAVELGGEEQEGRARALARGALLEAGVPARLLRTDAERRAQPEGLPQGVYREGPDL